MSELTKKQIDYLKRNNPDAIEKTGVDGDSGKDVFSLNVNKPKWITPTRVMFPNGKVVSIDPNESSCEIYNFNSFKIIFKSIHPNPQEKMAQEIVTCESGGFCFLRHQYYIPYIDYIGNNSKDEIKVLKNMGKSMFIGNKKASRPTTQKIMKGF